MSRPARRSGVLLGSVARADIFRLLLVAPGGPAVFSGIALATTALGALTDPRPATRTRRPDDAGGQGDR